MSWTEDRVAALKRLWSEGLSASQIAVRLGGVTRNAAIGKIHRLSLTGRAKTPSPKPRSPKNNNPTGFIGRHRPKAPPLPPRPFKPVIIEEMVMPISLNVPLLALTSRMCKFPTTAHQAPTAYIRFCGHPAWNGRPYCEYHSRLAYVPVDRRRHHDGRPAERGNLAVAAFDADLGRLAGERGA